jgi:hypothetical protein
MSYNTKPVLQNLTTVAGRSAPAAADHGSEISDERTPEATVELAGLVIHPDVSERWLASTFIMLIPVHSLARPRNVIR